MCIAHIRRTIGISSKLQGSHRNVDCAMELNIIAQFQRIFRLVCWRYSWGLFITGVLEVWVLWVSVRSHQWFFLRAYVGFSLITLIAGGLHGCDICNCNVSDAPWTIIWWKFNLEAKVTLSACQTLSQLLLQKLVFIVTLSSPVQLFLLIWAWCYSSSSVLFPSGDIITYSEHWSHRSFFGRQFQIESGFEDSVVEPFLFWRYRYRCKSCQINSVQCWYIQTRYSYFVPFLCNDFQCFECLNYTLLLPYLLIH